MSSPTEIPAYLNYINGQWTPASTGEVEVRSNPANTSDKLGTIAMSSLDDLNLAVSSAKQASRAWKSCQAAHAVITYSRPPLFWKAEWMKLPKQ